MLGQAVGDMGVAVRAGVGAGADGVGAGAVEVGLWPGCSPVVKGTEGG